MAISIYVHFPFCIRKCPYCDFYSVAIQPSLIAQRQYTDALIDELRWRASDLFDLPLESVYFGGGTPSLWDPAELGRVLEAIVARFSRDQADTEVTLECNPGSITKDRAAAYRRSGVNRLSIGVQSLDDRHLRYLERPHDGQAGLDAIELGLVELGRVGVDMIYGLAEQTTEAFCGELERLAGLGVKHLSAYSLTIETNTPFGKRKQKGQLSMGREEDAAECFLASRKTLEALGFEHYEVSNYALPGEKSRHNQHYWRGGDYLGLGASAVGCLHTGMGRARRYRNTPDIDRYIAYSKRAEVESFEEQLGPLEIINESLMLGLRTRSGVHLPTVQARSGLTLLERRDRDFHDLLQKGLLVKKGDWLKIPAENWLYLDSIVANAFMTR
ncbi:MAG: radical SAM family heme chaperone HemW [Deltaproteobacteria bacterium]|nr:radical SAM family heme chaperone HemW [Deltaproteobacteria bacterium]